MIKSFLIALKFLTIFPVGKNLDMQKRGVAQSMVYFPLVGALIGLLLVAVDFIFKIFFPSFIVNIFILIFLALITGALHLDGFIDSMDGLLSGKGEKKILKIMRDSRIGSFGVLAVIFLILLKLSFLNEIVSGIRYPILILMPIISRWAVVYAAKKFPYARETSGTGEPFAKFIGTRELIYATVFTAILAILLMQLKGIIILFIAFLILLLLTSWINKKIHGMTGDTYGAIIEIVEVVILISAYFINLNLYG